MGCYDWSPRVPPGKDVNKMGWGMGQEVEECPDEQHTCFKALSSIH